MRKIYFFFEITKFLDVFFSIFVIVMRCFFSFIFLVVLISSCTFDEPFIDETIKDYRLLAVDTDGNDLVLYDVNEGRVVASDLYSSANEMVVDTEINNIQQFKHQIFLIKQESKTIEILTESNFKSVAEIDFSEEDTPPVKIVFHPGATSAYVMFENAKYIYLMDITDYSKVKKIDMPAAVSDIDVSGSMIYAACTEAKAVAIIDSRSQDITGYITVDEFPVYLAISADATKINILARKDLGNDGLTFYAYNLQNLKKLKKVQHLNPNIGINKNTGEFNSFNVSDLVVTKGGVIYFSVAGDYVLSLKEKVSYFSRKIKITDIEKVCYSYKYDELLYVSDFPELDFYFVNPKKGTVIGKMVSLPNMKSPFIFLN